MAMPAGVEVVSIVNHGSHAVVIVPIVNARGPQLSTTAINSIRRLAELNVRQEKSASRREL